MNSDNAWVGLVMAAWFAVTAIIVLTDGPSDETLIMQLQRDLYECQAVLNGQPASP